VTRNFQFMSIWGFCNVFLNIKSIKGNLPTSYTAQPAPAGRSGPHLMHRSLGQPDPPPQTASRSNPSFFPNYTLTDRRTDRQTHIANRATTYAISAERRGLIMAKRNVTSEKKTFSCGRKRCNKAARSNKYQRSLRGSKSLTLPIHHGDVPQTAHLQMARRLPVGISLERATA